MKILLVKPYNLSDHIQPSLGLAYLASAVRAENEVKILDCIKDKIRIDRFADKIKEYRPDVVGFQCYTFDLKFVKDALKIVKAIRDETVTLAGGPHPSSLPVQTLEYFGDSLDFGFRGESERGFSIFIKLLKKNIPASFSEVPGLIWREKGSVRFNDLYFEEDLDSLGYPAWNMVQPQTYPEAQHGAFFKNFPVAPIMLTRGCPFDCTFCAGKNVSGRKLRKRSVDRVISEIKMLYEDYGIREFHIIDDNFTLDKIYAKEFCRQLLSQNIDISWAVPNGVRVDSLDDELLRLMKDSGLYLISLGIESGSDRILKLMKKDLGVDKIRERVKKIRQAGLDIAGFFILGFPGETKGDILSTIKFSLELDLIRANYFTYLPFPGTQSYNQLLAAGELKNVDWERFYFMNAAFSPNGLSRKELKRLQRMAFIRFYLIRPKILWKNIAGIRSLRHFKFLVKRFFHWIIMN